MNGDGSNSGVILSLKRLAIGIGGKALFSGVDTDLSAGELVAVTGPSGIGKTTFLRAVAGLIEIPSGTILFHDQPPEASLCLDSKRRGMPAYRRRVLLVEQQPTLLDDSLEANLRHPFSFRVTGGRAFPVERMRALLDRCGLGEIPIDKPVGELSVGQKQRLSLIRALLLQPEVLLLDEPTSALDTESELVIESVLLEEARRGLCGFIVTHSPAQAVRLCGRSLDFLPFSVLKRENHGSKEDSGCSQ